MCSILFLRKEERIYRTSYGVHDKNMAEHSNIIIPREVTACPTCACDSRCGVLREEKSKQRRKERQRSFNIRVVFPEKLA
jgi:hypothetical protein